MKFQDMRVGMRVTATGRIDGNPDVVGLVGEITKITKDVIYIRWERKIRDHRSGEVKSEWNASTHTDDLDHLSPARYQPIDKSEFQEIKVL